MADTIFSAEENEYVKSVRITCKRNLAKYPLEPAHTYADRKGIFDAVMYPLKYIIGGTCYDLDDETNL